MSALTVRCKAHPASFTPDCDKCVEIADMYRELKEWQTEQIAAGKPEVSLIELVYT